MNPEENIPAFQLPQMPDYIPFNRSSGSGSSYNGNKNQNPSPMQNPNTDQKRNLKRKAAGSPILIDLTMDESGAQSSSSLSSSKSSSSIVNPMYPYPINEPRQAEQVQVYKPFKKQKRKRRNTAQDEPETGIRYIRGVGLLTHFTNEPDYWFIIPDL